MTSWRRLYTVPLACLALGAVFTTILYLWSVSSERERGAAEFAKLAEEFRTDLASRVQSYIDTLPGILAFVALQKHPTDREFMHFVSAVSLQQRFPGIALTFIADRVDHAELAAYLVTARADRSENPEGNQFFLLMPPGERREYMIVRHSVPRSENTIGYDLYDPAMQYRAEVDEAATSGKPTATAPLTLAKDRFRQLDPANSSVVVRQAIYSSYGVPTTALLRPQHLTGLVGVAFKTRELVGSVLTKEMAARLRLRILDLNTVEARNTVFDSAWLAPEAPVRDAMPLRKSLTVANRNWTILAIDRLDAGTYWWRPIPLLILLFGLAISILTALLVRSLIRGRSNAESATQHALEKVRQEQIALDEAQSIGRMGSWKWSLEEKSLYFSTELSRILELDAAAYLSNPDALYERIPANRRDQIRDAIHRLINSHEPYSGEFTLLTKEGKSIILSGRCNVQLDRNGKMIAMVGTLQDITARKTAEAIAAAESDKYRQLFENSLDGVMQTHVNGPILAANLAACRLFGCTEAQLISMTRTDVVDGTDERLPGYLAEREQTGKFFGELRMRRADGTYFDAEVTSSAYTDEAGRRLTCLVIRDISERKKHEREIAELAFADALTGLPNRHALLASGAAALADAHASKRLGALLFIDLDHFKVVNDAMGHATGDELLRQVSARLRAVTPTGGTVGRLGGDEFIMLATDLGEGEKEAVAAASLLEKGLRETLQASYIVDGRQFSTSASIGISIFKGLNQTFLDVFREADTAMHRAKALGRHRAEFFVPSMQRQVEERFAMAHALEHAIRNEDLFLMAQPQFDVNKRECGIELLARWTDLQGVAVPPTKFIPLAEELGLINIFGEWVIEHGCKTVAYLHSLGLDYSVSVNVSPRQFHQQDFVARVSDALQRHRIPPGQLIFEVTENLLIENVEVVVERMGELAGLGIEFSIDDFGTGYSSLAYLQKLPLSELKIDKAFVSDLPVDGGNVAIVYSIIGMAASLGLRVVAEGVETTEQFDALAAAECSYMQGFLLAKPMLLSTWLDQVKEWAGQSHRSDQIDDVHS